MHAVAKEQVIDTLRTRFEKDPLVFALWLEGSDAFDRVDEYSDMDVVIDAADGHEEAVMASVEEALRSLGDLDLVSPIERPNQHLWHRVFHVKGSSEYLYIDVDIQRHSRDFDFIEGDPDERPRVVFDKAQVVRFKPAAPDQEELRARLDRIKSLFAQRARVTKYVERGLFLETWAYYHRCVLQPLVELLRLRYRPSSADYWLVHASDHFPTDVRTELESLFKVASLEEFPEKMKRADKLFQDALSAIERK